MKWILCLSVLMGTSWSIGMTSIEKEELYNHYRSQLEHQVWVKSRCKDPYLNECSIESLVFTDALIDYLNDDANSFVDKSAKVFTIDFSRLTMADGIRIRDNLWALGIFNEIFVPFGSPKTYRDEVTACLYTGDHCPKEYQNQNLEQFKLPSSGEVSELLNHKFDYAYFKGGRYKEALTMFVLCRENRKFPCRLVVKKPDHEFLRDSKGELISLPVLGMSKKEKPYYKTDGHTPSGVYQVDGVMPKADKTIRYGKFRRLILNFIGKSENESQIKMLLPGTHHDQDWWRESVVARDVGRNYFRIHGTGWTNFKPWSDYFPFVPTRGCLTTREGNYNGNEYADQRILLDELLKALKMTPEFKNEPRIRAILYVLNINSDSSSVSVGEIERLIH